MKSTYKSRSTMCANLPTDMVSVITLTFRNCTSKLPGIVKLVREITDFLPYRVKLEDITNIKNNYTIVISQEDWNHDPMMFDFYRVPDFFDTACAYFGTKNYTFSVDCVLSKEVDVNYDDGRTEDTTTTEVNENH